MKLHREKHITYVEKHHEKLSKNYSTMESSRAWFCYWNIHSLRLLGHKPSEDLLQRTIRFLKTCESPEGGYGGCPGQLPHLATTYASIMALASIGTEEALSSIDRRKLRQFITAMRQPNGSFAVHDGGEVDMRAVYCAIASATLTKIVAEQNDPLFSDTASWIIRCQTYEGGFGAEPNFCEAHGGYTFCAVASLALLGKAHLLNADQTLRWLVNRQTSLERGFQGRTNKLVDGCYTFWQAASFFTLEYQLSTSNNGCKIPVPLFDAYALQQFVLEMCQDEGGGLRDKPDKYPDPYHTCYALSGLSIAQFYSRRQWNMRETNNKSTDDANRSATDGLNQSIVGGQENSLEEIHPLYNICLPFYEYARSYFLPLNNFTGSDKQVEK